MFGERGRNRTYNLLIKSQLVRRSRDLLNTIAASSHQLCDLFFGRVYDELIRAPLTELGCFLNSLLLGLSLEPDVQSRLWYVCHVGTTLDAQFLHVNRKVLHVHERLRGLLFQ